jgi:hypothetical protein
MRENLARKWSGAAMADARAIRRPLSHSGLMAASAALPLFVRGDGGLQIARRYCFCRFYVKKLMVMAVSLGRGWGGWRIRQTWRAR